MSYDKENIASSTLEIVTLVSTWEAYRVIENDINALTIEGFNKYDFKDMFSDQVINSDRILWDSLLLFYNLSDCKYNYNQEKINNTITENDIKLILSFCTKYGLPCWCDTPTANICLPYQHTNDITKNNMLYNLYPLGLTNRFVIASFVVALYNLYRDFLQVIAYNKNSSLYLDLKPLITDKGEKYINNIQPLLEKEGLQLYTPSLCPYKTFWEDKANRLQLRCNNMYHLAIYHLCLFASQKSFTGGYIKQCSYCGKLFVANDKREKFCNSPCTRQAYYSYKKHH